MNMSTSKHIIQIILEKKIEYLHARPWIPGGDPINDDDATKLVPGLRASSR